MDLKSTDFVFAPSSDDVFVIVQVIETEHFHAQSKVVIKISKRLKLTISALFYRIFQVNVH